MNYRHAFPPLLAAIYMSGFGGLASSASAAVVPVFQFTAPAGWHAGDTLSTYQEWAADPVDHMDGTPNVAFNDAGAGLAQPMLTAGHTGFVAGSGGFYSFSDAYTATAAISSPTVGVPAGAGTYLIVQTFATIDPDDGEGHSGTVLGITLTNPADVLITGVQHIHSDTYGLESNFPSSFGPVDVQSTIDEFWIPDFTGDFKVVVNEIIHSSLMGMRVDAILAGPAGGGSSPFPITSVPEPASLAVLGSSVGLLLLRRRHLSR